MVQIWMLTVDSTDIDDLFTDDQLLMAHCQHSINNLDLQGLDIDGQQLMTHC